MRYCLDTNIIVYVLKGTHPSIVSHMQQLQPESIAVPEIVVAELYYGALKSQRSQYVQKQLAAFLAPFERLAFGGDAAKHYASIRMHLEKRGEIIGPNDLLIAATSRAAGATLVTHNLREFSRVPKLKIDDWTV